jgi:hypothetical protein
VTGNLGRSSAALAAEEGFTCLVDLTVVSVAIPYLFSACAQLTFLVSGRRPVRGWLLARDLLVAERLQQGPQQRGRALGCVSRPGRRSRSPTPGARVPSRAQRSACDRRICLGYRHDYRDPGPRAPRSAPPHQFASRPRLWPRNAVSVDPLSSEHSHRRSPEGVPQTETGTQSVTRAAAIEWLMTLCDQRSSGSPHVLPTGTHVASRQRRGTSGPPRPRDRLAG